MLPFAGTGKLFVSWYFNVKNETGYKWVNTKHCSDKFLINQLSDDASVKPHLSPLTRHLSHAKADIYHIYRVYG